MIIQLREITKEYGEGAGRVRALSNIHLEIERGEFAAIYGQSGSGKSTLVNIIAGLQRPSAGIVLVDGIDIYGELSNDGLARFRSEYIGFVFQAFHLLPYLNSYENTVLPLAHTGMRKRDKRRMALEALGRVGLSDRLGHLPSELSGGQQQRVAIARAVVNNPEIIIADEPTGNLDQKTRDEIMEVFSSLCKDGRTILMVTHDPVNLSVASRLIELSDGIMVGVECV